MKARRELEREILERASRCSTHTLRGFCHCRVRGRHRGGADMEIKEEESEDTGEKRDR